MRPSLQLQRFSWAHVVAVILTSPLCGMDGALANPTLRGDQANGDGAKRRANVWIERVDVSDRSELPGRVVTITGTLPTPCHQVDWEIPEQASKDGVLRIQGWSIDSGLMCIQVTQRFVSRIALDPMHAGQVAVNDVLGSAANGLPPLGCDPDRSESRLASVSPLVRTEFVHLCDEHIEIPPSVFLPPPADDPDLAGRPESNPDRGSPGPITSTPGPLPFAAALAGWHSARRLRRRSKQRT